MQVNAGNYLHITSLVRDIFLSACVGYRGASIHHVLPRSHLIQVTCTSLFVGHPTSSKFANAALMLNDVSIKIVTLDGD